MWDVDVRGRLVIRRVANRGGASVSPVSIKVWPFGRLIRGRISRDRAWRAWYGDYPPAKCQTTRWYSCRYLFLAEPAWALCNEQGAMVVMHEQG